jgi:hypothetical protein
LSDTKTGGERFSTHTRQEEKEEESRVARWQIFKPKIPIWVNFGGS